MDGVGTAMASAIKISFFFLVFQNHTEINLQNSGVKKNPFGSTYFEGYWDAVHEVWLGF
ncbi:MAG: hypothetical protein ACI6PN_08090 [Polaribacter sp.]|uniref:hypothetical protein n=1 Tax=Polaribacter sp. TaxID=1920175 RepID=UPI00385151CB